jgi:tetratricopeptide (TPR) repeat protein
VVWQPGTADQAQHLLATAAELQTQGRIGDALSVLRQARAAAEAGGTPALAAQALMAIALVDAATGRVGDALDAAQQAANLFGLAGDRASEIRAEIYVASLQASAGRMDLALDEVQRSLGAAGQIGDSQLLAEVQAAAGQVTLAAGQPMQAAGHFRAGLALATELPTLDAQLQLRALLAVAVFQTGDAGQANTLLEEDARLARTIPDAVAGAAALGTICNALVLIERPLDALNVGLEVLARLQGTNAGPQMIQATVGVANLSGIVGRQADAARYPSQAVAAARQLGGVAAEATTLLQLGTLAVQRGDRVTGRALLLQARAQGLAAGLPEPPMLTQLLGNLDSTG